MAAPAHLYERAAGGFGPLWHLDAARTCFIGPLTYNAPHQHGAPVFLAGIYGTFRLRVAGDGWRWCRTAMIPAGVVHELDVGGEPIAVLYIEPTLESAHALATLIPGAQETGDALLASGGDVPLMRELWEDGGSVDWAGEALDDLIGFSASHARRRIDPRIARALAQLGALPGGVREIAARLDLSPHHFQHLFTRETGVPFRRYRAWQRMRAAIAEVARGSNFTAAAHEAGFCDQAHFNHDFRRTFGAPPSWSLSGVRLSSRGGNITPPPA